MTNSTSVLAYIEPNAKIFSDYMTNNSYEVENNIYGTSANKKIDNEIIEEYRYLRFEDKDKAFKFISDHYNNIPTSYIVSEKEEY